MVITSTHSGPSVHLTIIITFIIHMVIYSTHSKPSIHLTISIISLHMHILSDCMIWFSPWIRFSTLQYMWCKYASSFTLPWAPYIAIIRSRLKKGNLMPWWGLYPLSDLRESNEEPSKVCFENLLKNPNLLDIRSRMIWFKIVPFLNYPRWHDRHFKIHKYKVWFGKSLMLASYHRNFCFHLGP
jgi:hypothetical protein